MTPPKNTTTATKSPAGKASQTSAAGAGRDPAAADVSAANTNAPRGDSAAKSTEIAKRPHRFNRGTVVRHNFVDVYLPEDANEVSRLGIVVDHDDEGRPQVAWLDAISGPLELDTVESL